jgi:hypothetical protein
MLSFSWQKIKSAYQWRSWHAYLLLALAAVVVYGQTLFFDYSYFDDQHLILEQADILERANPGEIFFNDVFFSNTKVYYRPLLILSLSWDWYWGQGTVFAFHFSNLLLHIIAACLLFYLLRLINTKERLAFFLSLFFTVHPVLAQAVAWIPGRNDSLAAIFIFGVLIFLSHWFRRERLFDLICLWLLFLLALFTKETAALLPLLALGWILVFERTFFSWFKLGLAAVGATVAGFIWYLARTAALGATGGFLWESLLNNLLSPLIFLGKVFLPFNLSVYPVPADTPWLYGVVVLLALIALLIYSRPFSWPRVLFGFIWFWSFLVLGSLRSDSELFRNFLEHRLYVPFLGILIILRETENSWQRLSPLWRRRALIFIFSLLIILNWRHTWNFQDRFHFWKQAVASSPHAPLAHRNLGAMYYLEGDLNQAEVLFRRALALNPQEPMAHNNLAAIYIDRKDFWRAESELKKELEINPFYDLAFFNLGRVYYERGLYQEAGALWRETLKVNPRHQEAARMLEFLNQNLKAQ